MSADTTTALREEGGRRALSGALVQQREQAKSQSTAEYTTHLTVYGY
jgi:hypothetical protein